MFQVRHKTSKGVRTISHILLGAFSNISCHSEPFTSCHSEGAKRVKNLVHGRLREESQRFFVARHRRAPRNNIRILPLLIPLVVSFVLLFSTPAAAQDGGATGVINGEMVNLTKGGGSVVGQTITLKTSLKDTETGQSTTKTDASGKFEFKGLATGKDYSYAANLTYQDAEYSSDPVTFSPGEQTKPLKMEVYDATSSDEGIRIMASHTIFRPDMKNTMQVTEVFIITNETDKAFVGTGPALIGNQKKTLSTAAA
ncbi:MAG: hypothetical protein HW414_977 [Dehalococcoidia bacterium]|nr:hypothetical protein [Dehalococcoidia bacterium]